MATSGWKWCWQSFQQSQTTLPVPEFTMYRVKGSFLLFSLMRRGWLSARKNRQSCYQGPRRCKMYCWSWWRAIVKGDHSPWMPMVCTFYRMAPTSIKILSILGVMSALAGAGVDGRPTKYAFTGPLSVWMVTMDGAIKWSFPRFDHTDNPCRDVVDKPGDFICMTFDDDFVFFPDWQQHTQYR